MTDLKPFPPADPSWPEHVKRIYEAGCVRITELRKQIGPDGVCPIPFRCWSCDQQRSDFGLMTGDGVPLCGRCFDGGVEALRSIKKESP